MVSLPSGPLLSLVLACTGGLNGQQPGASGGVLDPVQARFDVRHVRLELRVDPQRKRIDGICTQTVLLLEATASLRFYLDGHLQVHGVTEGGVKRQAGHSKGMVTIALGSKRPAGSEISVAIAYGGVPREAPRPPWDGGFTWAETPDGKPWIATSCQGQGADLWWPCKDHPSDEPERMDLVIEVPAGLFCASNGVLVGESTEAGWSRYHWQVKNPIANYGVALNIAPYLEVKRTYTCVDGTALPVSFWVLPENKAKGEERIEEFIDHLKFMEDVCGPYPFRNEKYGVVETPHLGMEHQTIIAYGYGFKKQAPGYDWLHQHEMSHEWWANLVTNRDWKDMWIHEGIGTYMQALYLERRFGQGAYRAKMLGDLRMVQNQRPLAPRASQDSAQIYFGGRGSDIYYKGSWVCHSLRWLLGDETFFEVLRRWAYPDPALEKVTDGSQVRLTDTEELREIAERVSGRDLEWFFAVYLRSVGVPRLVHEKRGKTLRLRWVVPGGLPFAMPVEVEVDGMALVVPMAKGVGEIKVGAAEYRVDPHYRVLRARERRR